MPFQAGYVVCHLPSSYDSGGGADAAGTAEVRVVTAEVTVVVYVVGSTVISVWVVMVAKVVKVVMKVDVEVLVVSESWALVVVVCSEGAWVETIASVEVVVSEVDVVISDVVCAEETSEDTPLSTALGAVVVVGRLLIKTVPVGTSAALVGSVVVVASVAATVVAEELWATELWAAELSTEL